MRLKIVFNSYHWLQCRDKFSACLHLLGNDTRQNCSIAFCKPFHCRCAKASLVWKIPFHPRIDRVRDLGRAHKGHLLEWFLSVCVGNIVRTLGAQAMVMQPDLSFSSLQNVCRSPICAVFEGAHCPELTFLLKLRKSSLPSKFA
jgi:hypothetical protein